MMSCLWPQGSLNLYNLPKKEWGGGKGAPFAPKMLTAKHYLQAFVTEQNYATIRIPSLEKHIHPGAGLSSSFFFFSFFEDLERGKSECYRFH